MPSSIYLLTISPRRKHPVTRLIGKSATLALRTYDPLTSSTADGKWLVKNPTANLADFFTETHRRAKQIMAFDSLKVQNHVVMVINDADQDKDACNSWTNNAWEDASGYAPYCYGMMWLAGEGDLRGGINDQGKPLWETYGLDKIETYRNVLDCWTKNDAQAGNLDTVNWDTRTNLPRYASDYLDFFRFTQPQPPFQSQSANHVADACSAWKSRKDCG
jgi:hypothetical protein